MSEKNAAIVRVRSEWISKLGLGPLFKGTFAAGNGDAIVEATDYSLSDFSFVAIEFCPAVFDNGHWVRVFIPRAEVLSILVFEKRKDSSVIGFGNTKVKSVASAPR